MTYQHSYAHSIADPAAFWAEQAAHLGNAEAANNLAVHYAHGIAVTADLPRSLAALAQADTAEEARAWWQEAHRLLGACRYCGVPALRESLEDALRTRGEDPAMPPAAAVAGSVLAEIRALRDWSADHLPVSAAPCG